MRQRLGPGAASSLALNDVLIGEGKAVAWAYAANPEGGEADVSSQATAPDTYIG